MRKHERAAYLLSNCILIGRDRLEIPIEASVSPIRDRRRPGGRGGGGIS